jgi:hypothetical protein
MANMKHMMGLKISAVLFQEDDGQWSAQCLEYDIAAQAKTLPDLRYELERVIVSHIMVSHELKQEPFTGCEPAPREFWDMFEKADMFVGGRDLPFRAPIPMPPVVPDLRVTNR